MNTIALDFQKLLPLLIPILIIQLGFQVWAVIDLFHQPSVKGSKWVWLVIILALEFMGPVIYFMFGRKET